MTTDDLKHHNAAYQKRKAYFRAYYRRNRKRMIRMAMEWQRKEKKAKSH